jgi:hypothetical protein
VKELGNEVTVTGFVVAGFVTAVQVFTISAAQVLDGYSAPIRPQQKLLPFYHLEDMRKAKLVCLLRRGGSCGEVPDAPPYQCMQICTK